MPTLPLYRNERYKFGDKALEDAEFRAHQSAVLAAQMQLAARRKYAHKDRVFHAKNHGCLLGSLTLRPDRPKVVRHGLFADSAKQRYNVLARFSNGIGASQHDLLPDVRGLALKIFGARSQGCVDWLMTNSPNPFGRDQQEFVEFMQANLHPLTRLPLFLIMHPKVAWLLARATLKPVASLAKERYWSGHAYLLGDSLAMKFNVTPRAAPHDAPLRSRLNADYLRNDLLSRLRQGPLEFTLNVQLEVSAQATPIEDSLAPWRETDTPSIPVAELSLTREYVGANCDALRFTPAHYAPEHRPLGNMARGRLFTYAASQDGRGAVLGEPDETSVFDK